MSFVFRAFNKNRRRKAKDCHFPPDYVGSIAGVSKSHSSEDSGLSSSNDFHKHHQQQKQKRPQRVVVGSQTDDDDDDRTHPMNEQSPSHCSNATSSSTPSPTLDQSKPWQKSDGESLAPPVANHTSGDPSKRHLFPSLRRKSIPKNTIIQQSTSLQTPETVAVSTSSCTPFSLTSSSEHNQSPPTVKRGMQNRFSEIYTPTKSVTRKLTFQEPTVSSNVDSSDSQHRRKLSVGSSSSQRCILEGQTLLPAGKKLSDLKRGKRSKPLLCDQYKSSSKTMIMNGDIVVSASNASHETSDTATTASVASSKARALRREAERIARAAAALDNKGNELFERGHFDKAMSCYGKALKLKRRTFAHLLEEADDIEEQLIMCEKKKADPQMLVSMATSINNIAYLRQRNGDATPEETAAAYKKSLKIKRRILGNDSLSVGKTLNNIGSVHYLKREFDLALPAYEEALKIMRANLGDKHSDVATVMSNIGDVYLGQGNPEMSLLKYRQALAIRWESFGEKDPRVIRLLEKIAKVEIGDRMLAPTVSRDEAQASWDNDEASEVMVEGIKPISDELKNLQEEIARDIEHVGLMERKATVEMLKDKIIIIRGMRAIWEGSGPELLDNDTASVITSGRSLKSPSME
ncbi:expressed tetratricopeptide repeat protein [Nitzschia inconspicua]|uniref:Expressed tetratricopeptide repeat protein n=1 Tax=Nitzschia inconspicua TaxID=303405 RepID=A0A9K3L771_9STRA|nr:expressed tetratricopeptide repeat protein [Nitzschia inconspicua]